MLSLYISYANIFIYTFNLLIFREKEEGERERETLIYCSTYLYIHWLLHVCALTKDITLNLGVSGGHSNQGYYADFMHFLVNSIP